MSSLADVPPDSWRSVNCTPRWDFSGGEAHPCRKFDRRYGRAPTLAEKFMLARHRIELEDLRRGHDYLRQRGGPPLTEEEEAAYNHRMELLQRAGVW